MTPIPKHTGRRHTTPSRVIRKIGVTTENSVEIVGLIRSGFSYQKLTNFQKATGLAWSTISRFVAIPQRTLSRRQSQGRLQPDESDRLFRASVLFDKAVDLFEGDISAARRWLQTPQPGLNGETPLDFASTDIGTREVENLIGRLEHGIMT